jgi:hypothetical protein
MMDEAFLRRIQTKIKVDFVSPEQFHEIFRRVCAQYELRYDGAVVDSLMQMIGQDFKEPLRACHPRDVVLQIVWAAQYLQKEPVLDRDTVNQACRNYFITP